MLVPAFLLVSLVAGMLPSFSFSANLLVIGSGGLLFWLGLSQSLPRLPIPRRLPVQACLWLLPLSVLVIAEAVNFLLGSTDSHPTLSRLADPVLERYPARVLAFYAWLSGYLGMVRR